MIAIVAAMGGEIEGDRQPLLPRREVAAVEGVGVLAVEPAPVQHQVLEDGERKPEGEIVEMAVPPIIDAADFEAVQALLKTRSPALTAPRVVSGPTLLTGICFCAACGRAMTLRTGKGGQYRYYTCSTKARQGETGCKGRTMPMEKLDTLVADHIEQRLLTPCAP